MSFEIRKAERKGANVVIALSGQSGCGKTYSAIRLARGLVGEKGKIGVIDTEQKRASLYADIYGGFDVIDLDPPYSPARYREAIKTFKDAGYNAVVIDSMSHEWEGEGSILDMVDKKKESTGRNDVGVWAIPKAEHRHLMSYILNCGMHIILCFRTKFIMEQVVNQNGKKEWVKNPEPKIVTEPNSDYDMTVKISLNKDTKYPEVIQKCPEGIEYLFRKNAFITEEAGEGIIKWLNSRQRDKDALIKEGSKAKDQREWFASLTDSEKYLARKYQFEIKAKKPEEKPLEIKKPETPAEEQKVSNSTPSEEQEQITDVDL